MSTTMCVLVCWWAMSYGEIILSRSSLIADIYFIYVFKKWRDSGNGAKLYQCFEDTVNERSASVGVKLAIRIRIPMKHCIVNSIVFWKKLDLKDSKTPFV